VSNCKFPGACHRAKNCAIHPNVCRDAELCAYDNGTGVEGGYMAGLKDVPAPPADGGSLAASPVRGFASGAIRSNDADRIDPEGFMNPLVVERFCEYMKKHRVMADGNLRASDNWQKGMPKETAIKGMFRHFVHLWTRHRDLPVTDPKAAADILEDLCAIRFNVDVYMWEIIRKNVEETGRPW
jgi:hypothetical protein